LASVERPADTRVEPSPNESRLSLRQQLSLALQEEFSMSLHGAAG